ncbi:MAG TPA: hypothetical protein ENF89_02535 [Candidatus Bathyarchaeota archaeon]|nr:hypothetical protein [Candidatus Bathyarchaeota archaeon]
MSSPLDRYVSRIEEACGERGDYIVILRYDKQREALERILSRCEVEKTISGIMIKAAYRGLSLTLFTTGKILLKGVRDRVEAERTLMELLSD